MENEGNGSVVKVELVTMDLNKLPGKVIERMFEESRNVYLSRQIAVFTFTATSSVTPLWDAERSRQRDLLR